MRGLQTEAGTQVTTIRRRAWWVFVAVTTAILIADVLSKVAIVATMQDRAPMRLLGGLIYLVHTRNTGAAFSLAEGYTIGLSLLAIVVVCIVIRLAWKTQHTGWAISFGLIAGGALGNLVDRIFRSPDILQGGVVDFLSIADPEHPPWPVFNLADSALVVGVALAIWLELRRTQRSTQQ